MAWGEFLPYGRHDISEEDMDAVRRVLGSEWLTTGPYVEAFEEDLKDLTEAPFVVSVSSGTAALHTAYRVLNANPGDEVITPPLTFIATQAAAVQCGLRPVMVDVDFSTGTMDPQLVEKAVTAKTRAIVVVDYAGHPADLVSLREIATQFNLVLIEDASHSLGARYHQRPIGSIADITTFSFFPTKNIATGEGGAVALLHEGLAASARLFARQGLVRDPKQFRVTGEGPWHQEVQELGLNYRLPDILAALGSSQLRRLGIFLRRRELLKQIYDASLREVESLVIPSQAPEVEPAWHLYALRVPIDARRELFDHLRALGIGVQVNYFPAHLQPALAPLGYRMGDFPVSEDWYAREISLPLHTRMNEDDALMVSDAIKQFFGVN